MVMPGIPIDDSGSIYYPSLDEEEERRRREEEERRRLEAAYAAAAAYSPAAAAAAPEFFTPPSEPPPPPRVWNPPTYIPFEPPPPPQTFTPDPARFFVPEPAVQDIPDEPFFTPAPEIEDIPDEPFVFSPELLTPTEADRDLPEVEDILARNNAVVTPAPDFFDIPFTPEPEPDAPPTPAPDRPTLREIQWEEFTPPPPKDPPPEEIEERNRQARSDAFELFNLYETQRSADEAAEEPPPPPTPATETPPPPPGDYWGESIDERPRPMMPATTIESLAALPPLDTDQFGAVAEAAGQYANEAYAAQQLVRERDQPTITPELIAQASEQIIQKFPDADPARVSDYLASPQGQEDLTTFVRGETQAAIDDINRQLARRDAQARADATYSSVRRQTAEPPPPPPEPEPSFPEKALNAFQNGVMNVLAPYTRPTRFLAEKAVDLIERTPLEGPAEAAARTATRGGTTLLDKTLDLFSWPVTRVVEQVPTAVMGGLLQDMALFAGGPVAGPAIVPEGTADLQAALRTRPRAQREQMGPAIISALFGETGASVEGRTPLQELADDIRNGATPADIDQKYHGFWTTLGAGFVLDPLNAVAIAQSGIMALRGIRGSSARTLLEAEVQRRALKEFLPVADAEAVPVWEALLPQRRFSSVGKASQARMTADGVANLVDLRFTPRAGGSLDEIPTFFRSLAAEGADTVAPRYFNGMEPWRTVQDARSLAPDVVTALDTPASNLAQSLAKPVYDGPPLDAMTRAERAAATKGMYRTIDEKQADVIAELKTLTRRSALQHMGLNPDKLPLDARIQQTINGALSNVYLLNPRYYARNLAGDTTTMLMEGVNPFLSGDAVRAYNATKGRTIEAASGFFGDFPSPGEAVKVTPYNPVSWLRRAKQNAANLEKYRREVVYVRAHQQAFEARRLAAPEVGIDDVADIIAANPNAASVQATIRAARSPAELDALRAGPGTAPRARLTSAEVLGDLDTPDVPLPLRWRMDRIAQRAARGENVEADIGRLLDDYATHATRANHLSDTPTLPRDYADLKRDYDALVSEGVPHAAARAQAVGAFTERVVREGQISQMRREAAELALDRRFADDFRVLEAKRKAALDGFWDESYRRQEPIDAAVRGSPEWKQSLTAWEQWKSQAFPAVTKAYQDDLERLVLKARTAVNGTGMGGKKVADSFKTVDEMTAYLERRVAELRMAPDADPAVLRDAEEALANLKGTARLHGFPDAKPTAAFVAAGSDAHDALWILHFQDRLDDAARGFNANTGRWMTPDAEGVKRWNRYIDLQKQQFHRDRLAADAIGRGQTNWILHNYDNVTDWDYLLRWVSPWELWTTRTLLKTPLRMMNTPQYFSKYAILRNEMEDANRDLPEHLRQKVRIPMGFLPDWLADDVFVDVAKLALPTDMLDNYIQKNEQDEKIGKIRAAMQFVNFSPGPVADALLAMAPGDRKLWETQQRSPLVDAWHAAASAARFAGLKDVPLRPGYTDQDKREAMRNLALQADAEGWDKERWEAAVTDIQTHFTAGFSLKGLPLTNDDARRALDRAHTRTGIRSAMSAWAVLLAPSLQRDDEDKLNKLKDEYFDLPRGGGERQRFMEAHPELKHWFDTNDTPAESNQKFAVSRWFDTLRTIKKEYDAKIDGLPFWGNEADRDRALAERRAKEEQLRKDIAARYPGAELPERDQTLAGYLANKMFALPDVRDSNGVKDGEATWKRRQEAIAALGGQYPLLEGDTPTPFLAGPQLVADVQAEMKTRNIDSAIRTAFTEAAGKGYEGKEKAGAGAKTREEAQRLRREFAWTPPTPEQLADAILADNPNPTWTRAMIIARINEKGGMPGTLQQFSDLSTERKEAEFLAHFDPKTGVSSEPFYANKNAGVIIRSGADWDRYQKAKADDAEYDRRGAQRDPKTRRPLDPTTYVYDTRERAWLLGGPVAEQLWGLEQAVLTTALGPADAATGVRSGGKGWTASYTMPNGQKLPAVEALKAVNTMQTNLQTSQLPEALRGLPSERANQAAEQTRVSNQQARSARGGGRAPARSTGRAAATSRRAPVDRGPDAPTVNWFKESNLTKAALTGTPGDGVNPGREPTNVREGWRLGLGMTEEAFGRFIARNPNVDDAIKEMERRHLSIFAADADQNAVTRAVQEQALVVQEQLQDARAKETERRQGPPRQQTPNLSDAWLQPARIRQGVTDFDRAFRTGTAGYTDEKKWAELKANHPDVAAAITQLQNQANALKTSERDPDDYEAMTALYEAAANVGVLISTAKELETTARAERAQRERELAAGPPRGQTPNLNDAWLRPQMLRQGMTDFDKAFRTGTAGLTDPAKWAEFTAKHPEIAAGITELQNQANTLKTTEKAPDDYEAMAALFDAANNVGSLIATARQRDAIAEREAKEKEAEAKRDAKAAEAEAKREARQKADDERYAAIRARNQAERDARRSQPSGGGGGGGGGGGTARAPRTPGRRVWIPPRVVNGREMPGYWDWENLASDEAIDAEERFFRRRRRRR